MGLISGTRGMGHYVTPKPWNYLWKPGPYPKTEEERIKAAKKVGESFSYIFDQITCFDNYPAPLRGKQTLNPIYLTIHKKHNSNQKIIYSLEMPIDVTTYESKDNTS